MVDAIIEMCAQRSHVSQQTSGFQDLDCSKQKPPTVSTLVSKEKAVLHATRPQSVLVGSNSKARVMCNYSCYSAKLDKTEADGGVGDWHRHAMTVIIHYPRLKVETNWPWCLPSWLFCCVFKPTLPPTGLEMWEFSGRIVHLRTLKSQCVKFVKTPEFRAANLESQFNIQASLKNGS